MQPTRSAHYQVYHRLCHELENASLRERARGLTEQELASLRYVRENGTPTEANIVREILNEALQVGRNPYWFE